MVGLLHPFVYEVDPRSPVLLGPVTLAVLFVILSAAVGSALRAMRTGARVSG